MTVMEHTKAATLDLTKHGLHNVKEVIILKILREDKRMDDLEFRRRILSDPKQKDEEILQALAGSDANNTNAKMEN